MFLYVCKCMLLYPYCISLSLSTISVAIFSRYFLLGKKMVESSEDWNESEWKKVKQKVLDGQRTFSFCSLAKWSEYLYMLLESVRNYTDGGCLCSVYALATRLGRPKKFLTVFSNI